MLPVEFLSPTENKRDETMLSERVEAALNDQINLEFSAYYTYLSMSAHFEAEGLPGFAVWMNNHAQEELMHAMKFYTYVNDRRGRVKLQSLSAPPTVWSSPLKAFEDAFDHERKVSIAIDELVKITREENDNATESFLQWFVDEQVEEEKVVSDAIDQLRLVGDNGMGLFMIDREMAAGGGEEDMAE